MGIQFVPDNDIERKLAAQRKATNADRRRAILTQLENQCDYTAKVNAGNLRLTPAQTQKLKLDLMAEQMRREPIKSQLDACGEDK